ncbi:carbon storage regulator CsrA [Thermosyntropha sp.]|uniref:carbon storage regulator CsrA n=1 Tax=Thermosyntropha sp. TaxID=2740820 RepID=UPI0025CD5596|nr:carbon storage regulator CsrA [Thermosyntropha sp.]MBO8159039.1 carbon storage regulator CsrA [Thermosyntropha sp.]
MLVLGRKKGESIIIGEDIEISIIDVQKDLVKIGIKAPRSVSIVRKEIYENIKEANIEASKYLLNAESLSSLKQLLDSREMKKEGSGED